MPIILLQFWFRLTKKAAEYLAHPEVYINLYKDWQLALGLKLQVAGTRFSLFSVSPACPLNDPVFHCIHTVSLNSWIWLHFFVDLCGASGRVPIALNWHVSNSNSRLNWSYIAFACDNNFYCNLLAAIAYLKLL